MKLELLLNRTTGTDESTIGEMLADGVFECFTLEPPIKTDGSKPRAIPEGTYEVSMGVSPHFMMHLPHLRDVPGFDDIEIHVVNTAKDTRGCIGVGETESENFIGKSEVALDALISKIKGADSCSITIAKGTKSAKTPAPVVPAQQVEAVTA